MNVRRWNGSLYRGRRGAGEAVVDSTDNKLEDISMPSHVHDVGKVHRIACIPGDGIGVEITEAAIQVLTKLSEVVGGFQFDFTSFDWSSKK